VAAEASNALALGQQEYFERLKRWADLDLFASDMMWR
jgi:hypothetical protein